MTGMAKIRRVFAMDVFLAALLLLQVELTLTEHHHRDTVRETRAPQELPVPEDPITVTRSLCNNVDKPPLKNKTAVFETSDGSGSVVFNHIYNFHAKPCDNKDSNAGVNDALKSLLESVSAMTKSTRSLRQDIRKARKDSTCCGGLKDGPGELGTDKCSATTPEPSPTPEGFFPRDCAQVLRHGNGQAPSGVYTLYHADKAFRAYCDMDTEGGGWIVLQRRTDGKQRFYRNWKAYKRGFGKLEKEFWLGNDIIYKLTNSQHNELRIDLEDFEGEKTHAKYSKFRIGNIADNFRLEELGTYSGTAGDSLIYHKGMEWSTRDEDNDNSSEQCAVVNYGAWWYNRCRVSNLNGRYGDNTKDGIIWKTWKGDDYSLKATEMKIRPFYFK
ncbi:ficolin-2-like [Branchiostoma lanceolatum]|uniref:ficolin-2-like n=1 Tax=Branchiostoma lanceolatum TaxID=7740 RepID=UPI003455D730